MVEDCLFGLMHRTMDFCFCGIWSEMGNANQCLGCLHVGGVEKDCLHVGGVEKEA